MDARYYRSLTEKARPIARERERLIQKMVDNVVSVAPRKLEIAARAGDSNACIAEFLIVTDDGSFQEVVKRLKKHFENKGFKAVLLPDRSYRAASRYQFQVTW